MKTIYSTGPVENAAINASTSTWVKVLNLSENKDVSVEVKVFRLNGQKAEIASSNFIVFPLSSDFDVFEVLDILQYEVQISVSDKANVLVTVWGKDADANLLPAHRFVQNELSIISEAFSEPTYKARPAPRKANRAPRQRPVRR